MPVLQKRTQSPSCATRSASAEKSFFDIFAADFDMQRAKKALQQSGEQTARQRQIIDLLDNEAGLTEQERKLLHVLATAEKNDLQAQESERKQAVQKRIEGKKQRRERNHRLFLAAGLLIEAGLVDTKTGELCYKKDMILQALKEIKYDLETSPNPDA
ncbi:TPA: hypothetical protein ACQ8RA_004732 [Escherichia coli]